MRAAAVPVLAALLALPAASGAFELFDEPYRDSQIPVRVSADKRMAPECPTNYKPYRKAGATWNKASCSYFEFAAGGRVDRNAFVCDGYDHIEFERLDTGILALTGLNCRAGGRETGIRFNSRYSWHCGSGLPPGPSQIDLQSVALHEMGHMLGLGHTGDPNAVMYPSYFGPKRNLRSDDLGGVCFLYPAWEGPAAASEERPDEPEYWQPDEEVSPAGE